MDTGLQVAVGKWGTNDNANDDNLNRFNSWNARSNNCNTYRSFCSGCITFVWWYLGNARGVAKTWVIISGAMVHVAMNERQPQGFVVSKVLRFWGQLRSMLVATIHREYGNTFAIILVWWILFLNIVKSSCNYTQEPRLLKHRSRTLWKKQFKVIGVIIHGQKQE